MSGVRSTHRSPRARRARRRVTQVVGELVGACVQLARRSGAVASNTTATASGVRCDLGFEQFVEQRFSGIVGRRVVPLDQQLASFGVPQQRQLAHELLGTRCDRLEQHLIVTEPALDGRGT